MIALAFFKKLILW